MYPGLVLLFERSLEMKLEEHKDGMDEKRSGSEEKKDFGQTQLHSEENPLMHHIASIILGFF